MEDHVKKLRSDDLQQVVQSAEILSWADDPMVIEPLFTAADRLPNFAPHIVRSLAKFFEEERVQTGIVEIAGKGNRSAFQAALSVDEDRKAIVPTSLYESVVASSHTGKLYPMLEYLLRHGGPEHVALVRPFEKHYNPEIRKLASEFVVKMRD